MTTCCPKDVVTYWIATTSLALEITFRRNKMSQPCYFFLVELSNTEITIGLSIRVNRDYSVCVPLLPSFQLKFIQ